MPYEPGDPRNTRAYRTTRADILANNDLCHLCGHHGAHTADHIITKQEWLNLHGSLDGWNHPTNLAPAHGSRGKVENRCEVCGRLCNQERGARSLQPERRSRTWG